MIFGRSVDAQYVEELNINNPFENLHFEGTDEEKAEQQKQQDKENDSKECFVPWSWIENPVIYTNILSILNDTQMQAVVDHLGQKKLWIFFN